MAPPNKFVFYAYLPSMAGTVILAVLFGLSSLWHIKQMIQSRTWYFIPFTVGCLFETVGYIGRAMSSSESFPDFTKNPYIIQSVLLLLGPTLFAASIYMILGRLIRLLDADAYSLIPPRWLTKVFVLGDVLSFFAQGGGGGMLTTAKTQNDVQRGENIILGGLGIQILFFGGFCVVTALFHLRIRREPTSKSYAVTAPWTLLVYVLYAASLLIMVRSLYRVAEYVQGQGGALQGHEYWLYILDSVPMLAVSVLFNWMHPSCVVGGRGEVVGATGHLMEEGAGHVHVHALAKE
ncbi:Rta1 domain-containing protein [Apiospora hydei]|uniref:Rta1 domain-containing protein n=1 Tax=Apiospora hydei TaxID=1337664 RepID=A0ABR1X7T8_9PEZI